MDSFSEKKVNVLLVGSGGVGTMAAYALEQGGKASVTAVLRSNYSVVDQKGFDINSLQHGRIRNWRPAYSKSFKKQRPVSRNIIDHISSPQHDSRCSQGE